jgi:hypothetical protein
LSLSELKCIKDLEGGTYRLKHICSDLSLINDALKTILEKV